MGTEETETDLGTENSSTVHGIDGQKWDVSSSSLSPLLGLI